MDGWDAFDQPSKCKKDSKTKESDQELEKLKE
jgi:hypothetical protein